MAIRKCKECGKDVSTKASQCPHCGAKRSSGGVGCLGIVVLGAILIAGWVAVSFDRHGPSGVSRSGKPQKPPEPVIELVDFTCTRDGDYAVLRGRAKNISGQRLEYVSVIGRFLTGEGEDLGSERTYLDLNPVLPGQTSPFKIYGPRNPEYRRCAVEAFKAGLRQVRWQKPQS